MEDAPTLPEVIVINDSDDEEIESNNEVPRDTELQSFSWTDVTNRLLMLAKNRELRSDQHLVATVLRDIGISQSIDVQQPLRATCETLGELLMFVQGHDRRYRACEDLVMVMCEVLSLGQTAPCRSNVSQRIWMKEQVEGTFAAAEEDAMNLLYQMTNRWRLIVLELSRSRDSRAHVTSTTMSRLEVLSDECTRQIEHLQDAKVDCELKMDCAAEEWKDTMDKCWANLEKECVEVGEQTWRTFDDTYNTTGDIQFKYQESRSACKSLMHRAREMELRRSFFRCTIALTCSMTQVVNIHHREEMQQTTMEEQINMLGTTMLVDLEYFFGALQAVMARLVEPTSSTQEMVPVRTLEQEHRPELPHFAKNLEEFWLIYRNWLPPVVLDLVVTRFDALSGANGQAECPVASAVSRVCASLRADNATQQTRYSI